MEDFLSGYVKPDDSVLYHDDDPDLTPIRLSLPNPPPLHLIDGYGLPAEKQMFTRHEYPTKLKRLEEIALKNIKDQAEGDKSYTATIYKVQKEFWRILEEKREYYKDEIAWMKKTWWHMFNGYWFFNNGKPTYITGWHYRYLNTWWINGVGYPDYRDRDRKEFIFFHYAYTTHETFAHLDRTGVAIPEPDGTYQMIRMPYRTCYGVGQNKNRRSGNTNKGLLVVYAITTTHRGMDGGGIMSMGGNSAEEHFKKKVLPAWRKMPMFLRPLTSSSSDPSSIIHGVPRSEVDGDSLENSITYAETSEATFYDGKQLWAILVDESGKAKNLDVRQRHSVLQHCLAQGNGSIIHGWEYQPSTAEEMGKGGKAFKGLLDDSYFYRRHASSGQTRSGLFRLFMPADESLDGYIDMYGGSVKGPTLSPLHKKFGFKETATKRLMLEREQLLRDSIVDPEALVTYREKRKLFPLKYADSWIGGAGDIGFDIDIIDTRLAEIAREAETIRGNFDWVGEKFQSAVKFIPDPVSGRWYISKLLGDRESSQYIKDTYWDTEKEEEATTYRPRNPDRFTCGADPFNFKTEAQAKIGKTITAKTANRMSDGGIAVFWHRDKNVDPEDKPLKDWESNRFVCTYRSRTSDNHKYAEDVLMTCIYYGAMCFPEINIRVVWDDFHRWGFDGFLKYQVDPVTQKLKDTPGVTSLERSKQEGFGELRNYIALHGHREKHEDLLAEMKNIGGMEEMTKYDLLAAAMCALLGAKSVYHDWVKEDDDIDMDLYSLFR